MEERTKETRDAQTASVGARPSSKSEARRITEFVAWTRQILGSNINSLFDDSDWTFIVKLHAMIETALNAALVKHLSAPELSEIIAKLDTSNTATGKIAFAKALKILKPQSTVFIQKLSQLRNHCVHDVRNFDFDLAKHLESLSEDKRKDLTKRVLKFLKEEERKTITFRDALAAAGMDVMMELELHDLHCDLRNTQSEIQKYEAEFFRAQQESNPTKG